MPLWDNSTITRFSQEGENLFCDSHHCILTRISLDIAALTPTYVLPDDVISVRRITYRGFKLDPIGFRNQREVFQNATQTGTPYWYVFNNIGQYTIKLFPCPVENISSTTSNLWGSEIPNRCIVEYWRAPDFVNFVIPAYVRRRLLKSFVLKMCFSIEGQGQNLKVAQYFDAKWQNLDELYSGLIQEYHGRARKLCLNGITSSQFFPASPVLPIARFGIGVDDGY